MKYLITFFCILFSQLALANNYWYCPHSAGYVYLGDSPDKVEAACGKPDKSQVVSSQASSQTITQWVYSRRSVALRHNAQLPQQPLVIDFEGKVVKQIRVLQQAANNTSFCNANHAIAVGDSMKMVQATCGAPDYKQNINAKAPRKTSQTLVYTYNQAYGSPAVLTFKGFKLVDINSQ